METEMDMENVTSASLALALSTVWQLVFFGPVSLVCLNAMKWLSQRDRFFIALWGGYIFTLFTTLVSNSTTGYRDTFHYYFNAVTATSVLGFMLICFRLRNSEAIRNDHKFLMYLLMLYAVGSLIYYYSRLIKWHF